MSTDVIDEESTLIKTYPYIGLGTYLYRISIFPFPRAQRPQWFFGISNAGSSFSTEDDL